MEAAQRHADLLLESAKWAEVTRRAEYLGKVPPLGGDETEPSLGAGVLWWPDRQYGFCPLGPAPVEYGDDYWQHYQDLAGTATERNLNDARWGLVETFRTPAGSVLDVGIGNGSFLERLQREGVVSFGADVNPRALEWLSARGLAYRTEPHLDSLSYLFESLTFWDVLEHIEDPTGLLRLAGRFVFVATPIYAGPNDARTSKHHKPGEHCWYWTESGLAHWMRDRGFRLRYVSYVEAFAGRDQIGSFVFERTAPTA